MVGIGMTSPLLVLPACSLYCLFPGINPLEVFRAGYVPCSRTEELSPYIVVNVLQGGLSVSSSVCVLPHWCLVFCPPGVHSEQLCVHHHCPQSSCFRGDAPCLRQLSSSASIPKELSEVQSDFRPVFFFGLVLAIHC